MKKISFIGAGSVVFTRNVVKDLLTFDSFKDAEICLMDLNEYRLKKITECVQRIIDGFKLKTVKITPTLSREEALKNADAIIITVFNGDIDIWRYDIEIPMKYGVDINVGDTRSVSGIFRSLRNIPLMLEILADVKKYAKDGAIVLNYTNPMSILCKAMQTLTDVDVTGLCHSVQGTASMLASWLGVDENTLDYECVGLNHQAFFTKFNSNGKDLYPALREKIKDPEYYNKELVRNELFKTFGYYVTESSGHNSEYCAWFRKRPDLIEKYCTHGTNWNPGVHAYSLNLRSNPHRFEEELEKWYSEPLDLTRGKEYAAYILNARLGDGTPFKFNANLLNNGSVENLPYDACVEIPVVATKAGYERKFKGKMPLAPSVLCSLTAGVENLTFEGYKNKDRQAIIEAVSLDPLCSAVLSLEEVRQMCNELFEINKDYIGW